MAKDIKKIDAKGRFFITAKQRELLGSHVVVTNNIDTGYLSVYSEQAFAEIRNKLDQFNAMEVATRKIHRRIIGEAQEIDVDSQGRVSVNSGLWSNIAAMPGDEICIFELTGKLDICKKEFYDREENDLSSISGLETKYYVKGL